MEAARVIASFCEENNILLNWYLEDEVFSCRNGDEGADDHRRRYNALTGQQVTVIDRLADRGKLPTPSNSII